MGPKLLGTNLEALPAAKYFLQFQGSDVLWLHSLSKNGNDHPEPTKRSQYLHPRANNGKGPYAKIFPSFQGVLPKISPLNFWPPKKTCPSNCFHCFAICVPKPTKRVGLCLGCLPAFAVCVPKTTKRVGLCLGFGTPNGVAFYLAAGPNVGSTSCNNAEQKILPFGCIVQQGA